MSEIATRTCPLCVGAGVIAARDQAPPVDVGAERLRALTKARGLTQIQLAEAIGRTQTAVSYWMTGKRRPGLDDLCALAALFAVSTDYLIGVADA